MRRIIPIVPPGRPTLQRVMVDFGCDDMRIYGNFEETVGVIVVDRSGSGSDDFNQFDWQSSFHDLWIRHVLHGTGIAIAAIP